MTGVAGGAFAFLSIVEKVQASTEFGNNLVDFSASVRSRDSGTALLDASIAATSFQNVGENYFATMFMLAVLMDIADQ